MPDLTLMIGQFKITPVFWCLLFAFVLSSFSMWRMMIKEDYKEENIFSTTLFLVLSGLAFWRLGKVTINIQLAGAFWGVVLVFLWRLKSLQKDFWDGLDTLALPWLYFLFLGNIGSFLSNWNYLLLGYASIGLFGLISYPIVKSKYRCFSWYKSGKTGFLFWSYTFITFFLLFLLDFLPKKGLYLESSIINKIIYFGSVLLSVFSIYRRSEVKK